MKDEVPKYSMTYTHKINGIFLGYFSLLDINCKLILGTYDKNEMRIMIDLIGLNDYRKELTLQNDMRNTYHAATVYYYER